MSRIRVAIVGIGGRGSWLVGAVAQRNDAEVVAVCDRIVPQAAWAAEHYGLRNARICGSIEEILGETDCDAVMVTTGDAHHAEIVVPALHAGKFVFCEKPLETSLAKCQAIIDADEAAGGRTFVGFNLRYAPVYVKVKQLLDAGEIGDILTVQADEFYDGGRTYFRRWNRFRSEGGGLWITKACHDFDLLQWLADKPPVSVFATSAKSYYVPRTDAAMQCRDCTLRETCPDRAPAVPAAIPRIREENGGEPYDLCLYNAPSDTFDHGIATVTFAGNVLATYTCNVVTGFSDRRIRVSGTKGTIDGSLRRNTIILQRRDPGKCEEIALDADVSSGHGGADTNVLTGFFQFVQGQGEPKCRPRNGAVPVLMGLAATLSGDEKRLVPMAELALR